MQNNVQYKEVLTKLAEIEAMLLSRANPLGGTADPDFYTVEEFMAKYRIGDRSTFERYKRKGIIPWIKPFGRVLVDKAKVEEYVCLCQQQVPIHPELFELYARKV